MGQEKMVPAVFLDRDGVINKDIGYFSDPKKLAIFRSSLEGLRALQEAGFILIVVTNQSGIARGLISEKDVQNLHDVMKMHFKQMEFLLAGLSIAHIIRLRELMSTERIANVESLVPG